MSPKAIFSFITQVLSLATVYFLLGIAGLQLAVPPGFASAVFPAAGVAVAAILHGGYRLFPGIWLGSFGINLWVASQQGELAGKAWMIAASIALGSSLQAILSASLVRWRIKQSSLKLDLEHDIVHFLMLVGPVGCLISASWGNSVLLLSNAISSQEFPFNWWNWWVGDTIGAFLFAPLTLMLLQYENPLWRKRLTQVALPILAIGIGTVVMFVYVADNEAYKFKQQIDASGKILSRNIINKVTAAQDSLIALSQLVQANPHLDLATFKRFTAKSLANQPELLAFSWNPLVNHNERRMLERTMVQELGEPGFHFTEFVDNSRVKTADRHNEYIVTRFVAPPESSHLSPPGFDMSSETERRITMATARKTAETAISIPLPFHDNGNDKTAVLLFHPIFRPLSANIQTPPQSQTLLGYVAALFCPGDIFAGSVGQQVEGLLVMLSDIDAPPASHWLYRSANLHSQLSAFEWHSQILLGQKIWQLALYPTPIYFANNYSPIAWMMLAFGLILVSILQAYLLSISGRTIQIQRRVERQTQELAAKEKFLRLSQLSGGIGTWEADLINHRHTWSDNCFHFLHIDPQNQPSWDGFLQLLPIQDRTKFLNAITAHIEQGIKFDVEYRLFFNGKTYWLRSSGQTERDANGKATVMRGILQDVTEAHHTQQQILQLSDGQKAILENQLVGFAIVGNKHLLWVNNALENMLGYQAGELNGKKLSVLRAGIAGYRRMLEAYRQLTQQQVVQLRLKLKRKNGHPIWLDVNGSTLQNQVGESLWLCIDSTERVHSETALIQKESYQRALLDNFPFLVWLKDTKSRFLAVNQTLAHAVGADHPDELIGKTDFAFSPPDLAESYLRDDQTVLKTLKPKTVEEEHFNPNGQRYYLETIKAPVMDNDGKLLGTVGYARDISEHLQTKTELRIAETVFDCQQGMLVADANNAILKVNRAFCRITGYQAGEVVGKNPHLMLWDRQDLHAFPEILEHLASHGRWEGEFWSKRKSGQSYLLNLQLTAVTGQQDLISHYVGCLTDITEQKMAAEKIERLAFFDPLTGLPNRRLLQDRLKLALFTSQRRQCYGALLILDIDHFKNINDTLGHETGDLLLKKNAKRLKECLRSVDTIARLGGDEFVIILEDLSSDYLSAAQLTESIGQKILDALNEPFQLQGHEYHCSSSIGATLFNNHDKTTEELLKQTDIAMYQAKKAGRNTLRFFDPQMQTALNAKLSLEQDLRQAFQEKQFELYYQPQVDEKQQIIGAESLIRWHHPNRGLLGPSEFIPLAEETGLILQIGQWVLEEACDQLCRWQHMPHSRNWQLAVNVSARQLRHADFVEQVSRTLTAKGVDPHYLKLEITESMVLHDIEDSITKMQSLRELGVRFSMDDFGTGYSSLASLKRLPIDQLKIDQSFVNELLSNADDEIIVQTIIAMAKNLKVNVIAEGVETETQRQKLNAYDCSTYQGFLFSKPLPMREFEANFAILA